MSWICHLVTTVLAVGFGTSCRWTLRNGRCLTGIELDEKYPSTDETRAGRRYTAKGIQGGMIYNTSIRTNRGNMDCTHARLGRGQGRTVDCIVVGVDRTQDDDR